MRLTRAAAFLALLTGSLAAGAAHAQTVRVLGDFRDWSAYATSQDGANMCFALSKAKTVSPTPDGFTEAYLYLTHRLGTQVRNELNLVAGFTFAADTPATLTIGSNSYALFTQGDAAWLDNPAEADALAGAMRAGSTLVVEGTSDKGIRVAQTFSLSGATAASRAIDGECR